MAAGYPTLALGAMAMGLQRASLARAAEVALYALLVGQLLFPIAAFVLRRRLRAALGAGLRPAADVLVLGVLVAWGLVYNASWVPPCKCEIPPVGNYFAVPEVYGLAGLHAVTVLAYAVSRRHAALLPRPAELCLRAGLLVGVELQALLAFRLAGWLLLGVVPVLMPLAAPALTILFYTEELGRRWSALAIEAPHGGPYRESPPRERRWRGRPAFVGALALSMVLFGAWKLGEWLLFGWGPFQAISRGGWTHV
jgi:hypothetical protein